MAAEELDLQDCWDDIRPSSRPPGRAKIIEVAWKPPNRAVVDDWAGGLTKGGSTLLCFDGPTPAHRQEVYSWVEQPTVDFFKEWSRYGTLAYFSGRLLSPCCEPLSLLKDLTRHELVIDGPLRELADRGFRFTELFKALWEAYFLHKEDRTADWEELVTAIFRWVCRMGLSIEEKALLEKVHITQSVSTPREQLDQVFFLAALARQNAVFDRRIIVFDGLDLVLRLGKETRRRLLTDLLMTIEAAERWGRLGSSTGLLVGMSTQRGSMASLKRYNRKLSKKIQVAV